MCLLHYSGVKYQYASRAVCAYARCTIFFFFFFCKRLGSALIGAYALIRTDTGSYETIGRRDQFAFCIMNTMYLGT